MLRYDMGEGHLVRNERLRAEIESLHRLRDTDGLSLIVHEIGRRVDLAGKTVPLDESNWELKTAHGAGYRDALSDFLNWLSSRLGGHINDDGVAVLGTQQLSERKRKV
jgi:hypothetical protein